MTQDAEEAAMRAKAHQYGLEYVAPRLIETRRNWADLMPEELARATDTLPQGLAGPALKVLISDPLDFETIYPFPVLAFPRDSPTSSRPRPCRPFRRRWGLP
jgi:hypothetical protein